MILFDVLAKNAFIQNFKDRSHTNDAQTCMSTNNK